MFEVLLIVAMGSLWEPPRDLCAELRVMLSEDFREQGEVEEKVNRCYERLGVPVKDVIIKEGNKEVI